MKHIFCLLSFVFCLTAAAQDVQFTAEVSHASVPKGESFYLTYTLNAAGTNLRLPSLPDFDVLTPQPSTGSNTSMTIINGTVQQSSTFTFRYVLKSKKEGTFTIAPATVTVGGKSYKSNAVTMSVGGSASGTAAGQGSSQSNTLAAYEDIFIRLVPSKTTVYEQEAFALIYRLYTAKANFAGWQNVNFPDTKGFISQEIDLDPNSQWEQTDYNGKRYFTAVFRQQILQPQQAGTLEVGQGRYEAVMELPVVMGGRMVGARNAAKAFTSAPVKINVKPLPAGKPQSFGNAVGDFKLKADISSKEPRANEALTITLTISGKGNLRTFKNPDIKFPASFEKYDPKVNNNINTATSGISGSRTIEYLSIPRSEGKFVIPAAEFSYFNPETGKYYRLSTPEYTINVQKGDANAAVAFNSQISVEQLASDVRHIKTGTPSLKATRPVFFGSAGFWLAYLLPFLAAVGLFIFYKKHINQNADLVAMRRKRAAKQALKRLKAADKFRRENNEKAFCDELLKALWGYLSDKLNIPLSELNKDNVEVQLRAVNTDEALIAGLMDTLQTAEMMRYAPSQSAGTMNELYEQTLDIMKNME